MQQIDQSVFFAETPIYVFEKEFLVHFVRTIMSKIEAVCHFDRKKDPAESDTCFRSTGSTTPALSHRLIFITI